MPHIQPTEAAGRALFQRFGDGKPILMLNLLRFRDVADYSASPDLAPDQPITGAKAYARYTTSILPLLRASGGDIVLEAAGNEWFIGPEAEAWHRVLIVRQASLQAFFAFATDKAAEAAGHHRTAALADSRLLPMRGLSGAAVPVITASQS
jgi:hypothetical protein